MHIDLKQSMDASAVHIICDSQEEIDFKNSHGREITDIVSKYLFDPWTPELVENMEKDLNSLMADAE